MSLSPEVMLATTFAWVTAGTDAVLTVAATPYNIGIASGNYRICLAPTTGSVTDFLRAFAAALNASGSGLTFAVEMAQGGEVGIAASGTFTIALGVQLSYTLGNLADGTGTGWLSPYMPRWCAFFASHASDEWSPREMLVGRETPSGSQYVVTSGQRHESCEMAFPFIPHDPATAVTTTDDLTTWHGSPGATVGSTTKACPWSVRDLLATSGGKVVALSTVYQTARSSTALYHDLCSIAATDLAQPRRSLQETGSQIYHRWTARFLRQSTETRA